jgi:hypothetical protein
LRCVHGGLRLSLTRVPGVDSLVRNPERTRLCATDSEECELIGNK